MIKIEKTEVVGWEHAIRGMRNPLESWEKSDSTNCEKTICYSCISFDAGKNGICKHYREEPKPSNFYVGNNDHDLMMRLRNAGTDHRKFMRMILCYCDITAPQYWWSEADTYRNGVEKNSCSKMHKLLARPFEISDFSFDQLAGYKNEINKYKYADKINLYEEIAKPLVDTLNELRDSWINCEDIAQKKIIWYSILQMLPESYNQKRTVMMSYEALANMYHARKAHKLDEWREFCKWIESLPYSELITGNKGE